jgi:hypothetical protein
MKKNTVGVIALLVLGLALVACGSDEPSADATPSGTAAGASPTSTPGATGTPEAPRTPVVGQPEGFETSCGSAFAWGEVLPFTFACIDEPRPSVVLMGEFEAHGYAASTEGELVLEVRDANGNALGSQPVELVAETPGALAPWRATMAVPRTVPPGAAVVAIYFETADGAKAGEATSDVFVEPDLSPRD